jgi:hypothetical protein
MVTRYTPTVLTTMETPLRLPVDPLNSTRPIPHEATHNLASRFQQPETCNRELPRVQPDKGHSRRDDLVSNDDSGQYSFGEVGIYVSGRKSTMRN